MWYRLFVYFNQRYSITHYELIFLAKMTHPEKCSLYVNTNIENVFFFLLNRLYFWYLFGHCTIVCHVSHTFTHTLRAYSSPTVPLNLKNLQTKRSTWRSNMSKSSVSRQKYQKINKHYTLVRDDKRHVENSKLYVIYVHTCPWFN